LAEHLNTLFTKDIEVYEYVCNVIFTRPLPANSIQSIPSSVLPENAKVYDLLKSLFVCQIKIKECHDLFTSICTRRGLKPLQSSYVEGLLVNQGFFYNFASQQADSTFLNKIHFLLLSKLKIAKIEDFVHFAGCIKTDFKTLVNFHSTSKTNFPRVNDIEEKEDKIKYEAKVKKPSNRDAYKRVTTQLAEIKKKLREQQILPAKRMADGLITSQVRDGGSEFAALSLCQLSEYAKNLNLFELQLEWALKATTVAPLDYRTFGHVADAYINLEQIDEARKNFETCLQAHDDNRIYGLSGLARIERSRSNLPEAIEYIETAIKECGKDHVPYLIKAELLRDQHKYEESEKIYNFVCREFPEFPIGLCGKAAVLAEQKKFEDAEATYKLALQNYPKNDDKVMTLSGLGFLVARLGRFKESYKLLDESISLSTYENIIPHTSKARVLQMEGRLKDSEKQLKLLLNGRTQFVEVVEQLLELYLKTNQLEKAQKLYAKMEPTVKQSDLVQIRYSQLLKQQNKFEDALQIIDKIRAKKPRYTLAMNERAAIFKTEGKYNQATTQYREVLKINKFDRTANFGIQVINHIFNRNVKLDNLITNSDIDNPKTIDDYQTIGNIGLLKLSKGEIKEGKKLLLQSYNSNFKSLQSKFDAGLSLASLMLNQKGAALKPVKKPMSIIGSIQKTIVYGEQGKTAQVVNSLNNLNEHVPPFSARIIEMISQKYASAANDDRISQDDIYKEQLKNMLLAA
ncbi:MAG: tetratricopeptide (TPR) repeat protein, partial [Alteromonadaceae bacterium]